MLKNEIKLKRVGKSKEGNDFEVLFNSIVLFYLKKNVKEKKTSLKTFISSLEKKIIYTALYMTEGSQKIAADILGIRATTLNEKLKKYDIGNFNYKTDILTKIEKRIDSLR